MRSPAAWIVPLLAAAPALAGKAPDVAAIKDKMVLLTDGKSHYVAVVPFDSDDDRVFYGDGKRFFSLPIGSGGSEGDVKFSRNFVEPRVRAVYQAAVDFDHGKYSVTCGDRVTPLTVVDEKTARPMLAAASFEPSPRKWRAYALARDDRGRYYYVDRGRTPETEKKFRLFSGPKGNLKPLKMTNVVSDSLGDVFSTPTGSLRLILGKNEATWVEKEKKHPLLLVPVEDNVLLIYTDLGVYTGERLGTPCDDL